MTGFDYVVLIVLGLSVLVSVVRGAVREVVALASWIVSGFVAIRFAPAVSALFPAAVTSPEVRVAAAFIVVLVICLMLFALVSLLLDQAGGQVRAERNGPHAGRAVRACSAEW